MVLAWGLGAIAVGLGSSIVLVSVHLCPCNFSWLDLVCLGDYAHGGAFSVVWTMELRVWVESPPRAPMRVIL